MPPAHDGGVLGNAWVSRLLVVDDEEAGRDMLSQRLLRNGFEVHTAASGPETLAKVAATPYDLVLLDIQMPGMSGLEVLRALRVDHSPAQLPIIVVTGRTGSDDIVEVLTLGANDYIAKPLDLPITLARIRTQLSRKRAEKALGESEERYALAVKGANDGIWDWRFDTQEGYFSSRWRAVVGYTDADELTSLDAWFSRVHPDDLVRLEATLAEHCAGRTDHFECEHRVNGPGGTHKWVLARAIAVRDSSGEAVRIAGSLTDITEGKVADALTGLPNRILFMDRLGRLMDHARKHPEFPVVVMFLDLDRFKVVNDSLGHNAGDGLLVKVALRIDSCLRADAGALRMRNSTTRDALVAGCTVARMGGDEFGVLLGGFHQPAAMQLADRIHAAFTAPFTVGSDEIFTSVSIGIAVSGKGEVIDGADLLRGADTAMYRAKGLGPARTEVFTAGMRKEARVRLQTDTDLRRALDRNEFEVQYQPIVRLDDESAETFEALLRWRHPTRGVVGPSEFIRAIEDSGLIVPIGCWVLRQACVDLRRWQTLDPANAAIRVAVNLSARQLAVPDLARQLGAIVVDAGVSSDHVELEITEHSVMTDATLAARTLEQLKAQGFRLSIDDFGTGHSSLSYVHRFPIDRIKVDRSFLVRGRGEKDTEVVMRAIVDIGDQLGLDVIAEGIETRSELAKVRAINCRFGQGFLFAVPESSADIERRFSQWTRPIARRPA
jgi:diguanylate cyclase (GGDEF)-like protein/PAS domain S-box-containing protein